MPDEEGFVHGDVFDAGYARFVYVEYPVHEQERRAVGQGAPNTVDVVDRFGRRVVDEQRAVRVALDVALESPCRFRIDEMARPVGQDAALYPHAEQCQVAQYVEQFVSCYFVDEAELQVVDVSVRDADVLLSKTRARRSSSASETSFSATTIALSRSPP